MIGIYKLSVTGQGKHIAREIQFLILSRHLLTLRHHPSSIIHLLNTISRPSIYNNDLALGVLPSQHAPSLDSEY
jgi:hypothetical protein